MALSTNVADLFAHLRSSALAFITFAEGIPIVYYGTEGRLKGKTEKDANRPVLSQALDLGTLRASLTYRYIKKINWCGAPGCQPMV